MECNYYRLIPSSEQLEEPLPFGVAAADDEADGPAQVLVPGHDGDPELARRPDRLRRQSSQQAVARLFSRRKARLAAEIGEELST